MPPRRLPLLVGRTDHTTPPFGPARRPRRARDYFRHQCGRRGIADGHALGAIASGHAFTAFGSAAAAIAGVRADAAGRTMMFLDAVAGRQTSEVMAFHGARRAAAFRCAGDIDCLHILEHFVGLEKAPTRNRRLSRRNSRMCCCGSQSALGGSCTPALARCGASLRPQRVRDVAAFGRMALRRLIEIAQLNGMIAVAFLVAD